MSFFLNNLLVMIISKFLVVSILLLLLPKLDLSFLLEPGGVFSFNILLMWRVIRCLILNLVLFLFLGMLCFMNLCFSINLILVLLHLLLLFLCLPSFYFFWYFGSKPSSFEITIYFNLICSSWWFYHPSSSWTWWWILTRCSC